MDRHPARIGLQAALLLVVLLLGLVPGAALAGEPELGNRLQAWPQWRLPAPLPRPGLGDLVYPAWFEGQWRASLRDPDGQEPELQVELHFVRRQDGSVVGDRAFNAAAIGHAVLGEALLAVRDDPRNPNRQLARLRGDQELESTVVGRREEQPDPDTLLADELTLQVLHGPGDPRVSRIETLSRYRRAGADRIEGEQWQASYGSPADGLVAAAQRSWRGTLVLERQG